MNTSFEIENNSTNVFAQLLAQQEFKVTEDTPGSIVKGEYLGHGFVSFGRKFDGELLKEELEEAQLVVGQTYHFMIMQQGLEDAVNSWDKIKGGGQLAKLSYLKAKTWSMVEAARTSGAVVIGHAHRIVRKRDRSVSGLFVSFGEGSAKLDAFMPCTALVPTHGTNEFREQLAESFLKGGRQVEVKVLSAEAGARPIVGHALALQREKVKNPVEIEKLITIGSTYTGAVRNITEYGAFVDLGGVSGLLHKTEIVGEDLKQLWTGKFVEVTVIKKDGGKVGLSLKRLQQKKFFDDLKVGDTVEGLVRNTVEFGCFVTLNSELRLDGLLHWRECDGNSRPKLGDTVRVRVISVNAEAGRISLSLRNVARVSPETVATSQV